MRISIPKILSPLDAIRRCGFGLINPQANPSFVRRLGTMNYPRFHAYLSGYEINLHLDQKQASYEGYSAHSGEYDGDVVEREAQRISGILEQLVLERSAASEEVFKPETKGFWSKLFGNK